MYRRFRVCFGSAGLSVLLGVLSFSPLATLVLHAENPLEQNGIGQPAVVLEHLSQALAQLASPEYSMRRRAFIELWKVGKPALPALSSAKLSGERSVVEAISILEILIELDIQPNNLEQSTQLLQTLSNPTVQSLVELCQKGYWNIAERILQANSSLVDKFQDPYGRYLLSRLVEAATAQDNPALAWPIVSRASVPPLNVWISHKTGLDLQQSDGFTSAHLLFYQGDVDAALKLKTPAVVQVPIITRSGRWSRLLDEPIMVTLCGRQPTLAQAAVRAVLHEAAGDVQRSQELWDDLLKPSDTPESTESTEPSQAAEPALDPTLDRPQTTDPQTLAALKILEEIDRSGLGGQAVKYQFLAALMFSGRVEAIELYLTQNNPVAAYSFYLAGNNHARALAALGLEADLSNFESWLDGRKAMIVTGLSQRTPDKSVFDECARLCSTLSSLGFEQQTQQLLDELVALARLNPSKQPELWGRSILAYLGRSESRRLALAAAKTESPLLSDECMAAVLTGLFPELEETAHALWKTAPGQDSSTKWINLEHLHVFDRAHFGSSYRIVVSAWLERALESLSQENLAPGHLIALGKIASGFGDNDLAIELLMTNLLSGFGGSDTVNLHWIEAGKILVQRGQLKEALPLFRAIRQTGSNPQRGYVEEVHALLLSGRYAEAKALDQARWLRPLATTRFYQGYSYLQAARELSDDAEFEKAADYAQAAFLTADLGSMDVYWAAGDYAEILKELGDTRRSADVQRAAWVESMQPYSSSLQYMFSNGLHSSLRFSAQKEKLSRAVVCIADKDWEGLNHCIQIGRQLQPQDIEMVVQCFPLLEEAGETEQANQLFEIYESDMLVQIASWPNDATALNNLAWMYSQCDRKLEEAMRLSRKAVELAPNSAIFLDTLAEIEYRSGLVDSALITMKDCVRLDPRERHYRENLTRFREQKK